MNTFHWIDARTEEEAVACLHDHGPRAQAIAGGGDLLGLWKDGVRGPAVLVNLASVLGLDRIERMADGWQLGAMATLASLARAPGLPPMLAEAVARIASPQLRQRTTLAGNLLQRPRCAYFRHPDEHCFKKEGRGCPAVGGPPQAWPGSLQPGACHAGHPSDLAPVLLALDARVEVLGRVGRRWLSMEELFEGAAARREREAALRDDELLCRVHLPAQPVAQAFEKLAPREANEFSTAAAAVVARVHEGRVTLLRVAMSGVAPAPLLLDTGAFRGAPLSSLDAEALAFACWPRHPRDPHAHRRAMAREAVRRALSRVFAQLRTAAA